MPSRRATRPCRLPRCSPRAQAHRLKRLTSTPLSSLPLLFQNADIDHNQRLDLNEWLLLFDALTYHRAARDRAAVSLAHECARYELQPWACPLLRALRRQAALRSAPPSRAGTDTAAAAAAEAAAAEAEAEAVAMESFGVVQPGAFKQQVAGAECARRPHEERLRVLLTSAEKRIIRAANTRALREQVHKRDMALEAAAMRGCGAISNGVFDRHGKRMLRHDERSLLPLVREFDTSGDGVLRLSEFRLLLAMRCGEAGREPPSMPEATRLFKAAVRDDDGRLGVDELAKILDRLGLPPERPDYLK